MVALKIIDQGNALDKARFHRAALAWRRLEKHPNLVQIYERGINDGQPYIAMEFLEGSDLQTLITPRPYRLTLRDKISWMSQVCDGLCHLHRHGIIHQDIRPSSIVVLRDGTVKILESGMARQALPQDLEVTRTRFLLDDYRAPEQERGRSELRSDVFSAGKVLFELLTYRRLVGPGDPEAIEEQVRTADPSLPPDIVTVVQRALRRLPAERFDIEEMRNELQEILRRLPDTTSNRGRVLFALHGIRTDAPWQKALMEVAYPQRWNCRAFPWGYGYFSLVRFLLPWQRSIKVDWFRKTYDVEVKSREVDLAPGQLPSIVAHSFGTYILGQALLAHKDIRFDKVILCGSILPCDFPWELVIGRGQVKAVRNEYGTRDAWPQIVRWFVRSTGPSGRIGFDSKCHPEQLEQEEFLLTHSAYFDKGHVENFWFPFLNRATPDRPRSPVSRTHGGTNKPIALYLLWGLLVVAAIWSIAKLYAFLPSILKLE